MYYFQIFVSHFEHIMISNFHRKIYSNYLYIYNAFLFFCRNWYVFTLVFALRVRPSICPQLTSSVSFNVRYCHKTLENVLTTLNMEFYRHWLVRFRDIDALFSTGSRILNQKWTLIHTKMTYILDKKKIIQQFRLVSTYMPLSMYIQQQSKSKLNQKRNINHDVKEIKTII